MIVSLKKINKKIYTVLGSSIAFVSIVLISAHAWHITQNLKQQDAEQSARLKEAFFSITSSFNEFYRFRASANANSPGVKEAIKNKDTQLLQKLISNRWNVLREENRHLTIMQIHAADGSSLLRLHEQSNFRDNIAKMRFIVKKIHETHIEQSGIEKGKHGIAHRVIYPVFDKKEYIGAIEFGVSPEYIVDTLAKLYNLPSSILIHKSLMQNAKIDKEFLSQDFVPLAFGAVNNQLKALKNTNLNGSQRVTIGNKVYAVHTFELSTTTGDKAAKIAIAQDVTEQYDYLYSMLLLSVFLVVACGAIATIFLGKYLQNSVILVERARQGEKEQAVYLKTVLDSQQAIIIVTDGYELADANQKFFDFFGSFKDLQSFKNIHNCICDLFINSDGYLQRGVSDKRWVDIVLQEPNKYFLVKMADMQNEEHIFEVFAKKTVLRNIDKIVVTFDDVTIREKAKKTLEEKAAQDEMLAMQNSKLASMGEMISLIAHQWRQPLNALSIMVHDVKIAYQYGDANELYIEEFVEKSVEQINYMSKTIDDFRNFIKPNIQGGSFSVQKSIQEGIDLLKATFIKSGIFIELRSNVDEFAVGNTNEFKQSIINILKNAKDSMQEAVKSGIITIDIEKQGMEIIVKIGDDGAGISDDSKLFLEYYTTKESDGTGLGLFMSKKIIEKMGGTIKGYNKQNAKGAIFEITLPICPKNNA